VKRHPDALADLLDEEREAATLEVASEARQRARHSRVRATVLPAGQPLTGPDALIVAEVPNTPIARARLAAIQLHGVLSMAGDPFEDPAVIEAEVTQLLATIAREWSAHKEASDVR
jgi:hypothetical protein